jgi:alpha-L-rhamnosidase
MSRMAQALGKTAEAERYAGMAAQAQRTFNAKYLERDNGWYPGKTQAAQVLPLFFDLVPPDAAGAVTANLVGDIEKRRDHLSTGFLGTGSLNPVLTATGHHDLAWKLATQTTYPSWGYMVEQGATTIWELWNSDKAGPGMNSRNHFALGSVGEWFYEALGGLQIVYPGFRDVRVAPLPVGDLRWVQCSKQTPYGMLTCNWTLKGDTLQMEVVLPANTRGSIRVPLLGNANAQVEESGTVVARDGQILAHPAGLSCRSITPDALEILAGAGRYRFTVKGAGKP